MHRPVLTVALLFASITSAAAQSAQPAPRAPEPAIRRWFEFQQLVLSTRYRFIRNSADVTTSNHMQYREQVRFRVNVDAKKRYTLNVGLFTGTQYIASWNNLGPGTGTFDGKSHYMRQFFFDATPLPGIEAQVGSLYPNRGEHTEYTTYDDDGWVTGGRLSLRRPKTLYFDDLSLTHGTIASTGTPNLWKRWDDLDHTNYTQVLVGKHLTSMVAASVDYTRHASRDTFRGAVSMRFKPTAPISALRYEQYVRTTDPDSAAGFAVTVERPITRWVRAQGGYATIDEHYGGLNADRIQRGRRFYAVANVPIHGPLTASFFVTRALDAPYTLSNKTRFDAVLAYDLAAALRQTGKF
ncbi:MAG: hypothetical protein JSU08_06175 [Acidobacteria bacterium]|nr:hypothetical protein [Acidobacteriota bacterium]